MDDPITLTIIVALLITAVTASLSGAYITWVYHQRTEEALFLTRLVHRDLRVAIASAVIVLYMALSLAGFGLGRPWGAVAIGIPIIVLMIGPIGDALLWRKERRMPK